MSVRLSKFPSTCPKCRKQIQTGTPIVWGFAFKKYVHEVCPNGSSGSRMDLSSAIKQAEANSRDGESVSVAPANFVPSVYQQAIGDFVKDYVGFCESRNMPVKKNGVVEAVAGSGKTTTLVWVLQFTDKNGKVVFLAFNKHIADELKNRQNLGQIPEHIRVSTIHSLGLSIIKEVVDLHPRDGVDNDKVSSIMDAFWPLHPKAYEKSLAKGMFPELDLPERIDPATRTRNKALRSTMRSMVSLAKATLVDVEDQNAVLEMCERYGVEVGGDAYECVYMLPDVMKACLEIQTVIDFDDMIWLPIVDEKIKAKIEKMDFVMVDEGQDLNPAQIAFVLSLIGENGRIIVVGDRKQSLYGFRGADTEAIPRLVKELDAVTLPLSISYRNPKSVVEAAKELVPQIEAWENAKEGQILKIKYPEFANRVKVGDMVVCRTNAPLVEPAFNLIKRGNKAIIRGRDIGQNLIDFVERFGTDDLIVLDGLMREWVEREHERLIKNGKELAAAMVIDKHEVIMGISMQSRTVMDLVEKLRMMFSDKVEGVVFSSIHRAKGLEAKNVYILHPELLPHPKANMESWEGDQEWNCKYVAITRAKESLIWVLPPEKQH